MFLLTYLKNKKISSHNLCFLFYFFNMHSTILRGLVQYLIAISDPKLSPGHELTLAPLLQDDLFHQLNGYFYIIIRISLCQIFKHSNKMVKTNSSVNEI